MENDNNKSKTKRRDVYSEVTNKIVAALEEGTFGSWFKPWVVNMPMNLATCNKYRGIINCMLLGMSAQEQGLKYPSLWATYLQVQRMGGQVLAGSKGTQITYYGEAKSKREVENDKTDKKNTYRFLKFYTVFALEQTSLPVEEIAKELIEKPSGAGSHSAEDFISAIDHEVSSGSKACYIPSEDRIVMPEKSNYYSTTGFLSCYLHELLHFTNAPQRCDRQFDRSDIAQVAQEELIAELGSAMLCTLLGIEGDGLQHTEYIGSWIKALKNDTRCIFKAAAEARKAVDFLFNLQSSEEVKNTSIVSLSV